MKYVKVTVDNRDIFLEQQHDGTWETRTKAPSYAGVYPVTVEIQGDSGQIVYFGYDDETLGEFLKLIVEGKSISGTRLLGYLPPVIQDYQEIKEIMESQGNEVDRLLDSMNIIISDSFILESSESRIEEWEKRLKISPNGTLSQRRSFILSVLRGIGKLNEQKIKNMVRAFTGGDATITFSESVLDVKILPPANGDVYLFPDVERALLPRIPSHIELMVRRWYSSWNDVKNNYVDWNAILTMGSWGEVKKYIPPQQEVKR